jgi:hypothetical protein
MATLANSYRCIDDWGSSAGPAGGQAGGTSGQPLCPDFTAPSVTAAGQFAFILASLLQRPVRLVQLGGSPPWTLIQGQPANVSLTSVPSGIGF